MGEIVIRNGEEINLEVARIIKKRILREEDWNQRTRRKLDSEMIDLDKKIVEEEVNAYQKN